MDLITRRMELNRYDENSGTHCIATGLNYFPVDRNTVREWSLWNKKDYKKIIDDLQKYWNANQKLWEEESAECQTIYQYLKENIHTDD
jgi:protein tyrosine/serine phosphatase